MSLESERAAAAFAAQLVRWSERAAAAPEAVQRAEGLGRRLFAALEAGHSCLPLDAAEAAASLATGVVGRAQTPGSFPLLLDGDGRLYLHRHYDQERRLAGHLVALGSAPAAVPVQAADREALIAQALARRLTVISGGPGTGKTTTVVALLGALLAQAPGLRIGLAAPTGKAAARLQEAIEARAASLPEAVQARLPRRASTLHRLLGQDAQGRFRHHAARPLPLDVLVIDEASMLDLALATRVCDALPAQARLLLLGDRDQLAAVESGAVFAELAGLPAHHPLRACVVHFERQYRFAADSPIARLATAVRSGDATAALAALSSGGADLDWLSLPVQGGDGADGVPLDALVAGYQRYWDALAEAPAPDRLFAALADFRVLCALRSGPWGSEQLSARLAARARALLDAPEPAGVAAAWFRGRPVMITRNDPVLQLFNGDIGITLPDPASGGELRVCFPAADGSWRWIAPLRLPPHETAFAISVHKSQGSEFQRVAVVLPPQPSPVLTRELLYTAVTRARSGLCLVAAEARLREAVATATRRDSGLRARLDEALAAVPAPGEPGTPGG